MIQVNLLLNELGDHWNSEVFELLREDQIIDSYFTRLLLSLRLQVRGCCEEKEFFPRVGISPFYVVPPLVLNDQTLESTCEDLLDAFEVEGDDMLLKRDQRLQLNVRLHRVVAELRDERNVFQRDVLEVIVAHHDLFLSETPQKQAFDQL